MTSIRPWLLIGLLAYAVQSGAAQDVAFVPVAHSALLAVDAAGTAEGVRLRLRRTEGAAPLAVTELRVSIQGENAPVTQQPDGTWLAAWPKTAGKPDAGLEVMVTHDGIREELSGPMPPPVERQPSAGSGAGSSAGRKQLAWWILNIAIVLIAVIAISRRVG